MYFMKNNSPDENPYNANRLFGSTCLNENDCALKICENHYCRIPPYGRCNDISQCSKGFQCMAHYCLPISKPGELYGYCDSTSGCNPELKCFENTCIPVSTGHCLHDIDCGNSTQFCLNKICTPMF